MYQPDPIILKRYADVLVKFALRGGKGVKPGEIVYLIVPDCAKLMLEPLQAAILESGAHFILDYRPDGTSGTSRVFYDLANDEQIIFAPKEYLLERVRTMDHSLAILADNDKYALKGVDSKKLMARQRSMKFFYDAREAKENQNKFSWTLGLYGTQAYADDVGMTIEEYWNEIISACFLDHEDPVVKWNEVFSQIASIKHSLDSMKIESLHIQGEDVDLRVRLGEGRQWLGGSGRNIPSFEVFISPDWRGTEGWIRFNQPLYRFGNKIDGIELEFKEGKVTSSTAKENEALLKEMIATENADKIGEFSLTDRRFSRITKFMGETLYDENMGGAFGNTHIALGNAYKDSYPSDPSKVTDEEWKRLGYNESAEHCDIISTTNRTVTAELPDGTKCVIYKDGEFQQLSV